MRCHLAREGLAYDFQIGPLVKLTALLNVDMDLAITSTFRYRQLQQRPAYQMQYMTDPRVVARGIALYTNTKNPDRCVENSLDNVIDLLDHIVGRMKIAKRFQNNPCRHSERDDLADGSVGSGQLSCALVKNPSCFIDVDVPVGGRLLQAQAVGMPSIYQSHLHLRALPRLLAAEIIDLAAPNCLLKLI
ncbi:hypothetical protein ADT71_02840 [Novosphingobium sp. ST904]|nr:hypothetical protein ADT71_02840 [Novosphingobium sp. ST904]